MNNFSYTFSQAHNDRLEDAGYRHNQQPQEGYVIEHKEYRKSVTRRVKQIIVTAIQTIVR